MATDGRIDDIKRKRGADYPIVVTVGNVDDLTGSTVTLGVNRKEYPGDDDAPEFILNGTVTGANTVEFQPSPEDVDRVGTFYCAMLVIGPTGKRYPTETAKFILTQDLVK